MFSERNLQPVKPGEVERRKKYEQGVRGFAGALQMAVEGTNVSEEEGMAVLENVFGKLDQNDRQKFLADVVTYVNVSGVKARWKPEQLAAARALFSKFQDKYFIHGNEQKAA